VPQLRERAGWIDLAHDPALEKTRDLVFVGAVHQHQTRHIRGIKACK
jgi:hypothetical protein